VAPLTAQRMYAFFALLRERVRTARVFAAAGRDYALFRALYHAGL
jgi:integrase/recombinase XerD